MILPADMRQPIFKAAADALGVRFKTNAQVRVMDAGIDAAMALLSASTGAIRSAPIVLLPVAGPIAIISTAVLKAACPERSTVDLAPWVAPIKAACAKFEINTIRRVAAFIAQMAHESGLKPGREEDLRYSAQRLAEVWPHRYAVNPKAPKAQLRPNAKAQAIGGNPKAVANDVYSGRMGNGPPESGDGWKFRGAGPGQNTGRDNWTGFALSMGMTIDEALIYGRTLEGGIMAFAWFWEENDINRLADTPGVNDESRRINGGDNGLDDRKARFDRTIAALLDAEHGADQQRMAA